MHENLKPYVQDGTLHFKRYVKLGEMLVDRYALSPTHPEHIYNHLLAHGFTPEEYGIEHPHTAEFKEYSRSQLISEIVSLRNELDSIMRYTA